MPVKKPYHDYRNIYNTFNNRFPATGKGIQDAIDDLGTDAGTVFLPPRNLSDPYIPPDGDPAFIIENSYQGIIGRGSKYSCPIKHTQSGAITTIQLGKTTETTENIFLKNLWFYNDYLQTGDRCIEAFRTNKLRLECLKIDRWNSYDPTRGICIDNSDNPSFITDIQMIDLEIHASHGIELIGGIGKAITSSHLCRSYIGRGAAAVDDQFGLKLNVEVSMEVDGRTNVESFDYGIDLINSDKCKFECRFENNRTADIRFDSSSRDNRVTHEGALEILTILDYGERNKVGGVGHEAAGIGQPPQGALWMIGDICHNTDDDTFWILSPKDDTWYQIA